MLPALKQVTKDDVCDKTSDIESIPSVCQEGLTATLCVCVCMESLEQLNMTHGFMRLSVCN